MKRRAKTFPAERSEYAQPDGDLARSIRHAVGMFVSRRSHPFLLSTSRKRHRIRAMLLVRDPERTIGTACNGADRRMCHRHDADRASVRDRRARRAVQV
jgi:hypothetical protein